MKYRTCIFLITYLISLIGCGNKDEPYIDSRLSEAQFTIPKKVDFSLHIKPILSDRCFKCHGPDKNAVEGNLSLQNAGDAYKALGENFDRYAIVPGKPEKSELVHRVFSEDPGLLMPPPESNLVLSEKEKYLLKKWVEQGAEYKEHWAFIKPKMPVIPALNGNWGYNEIDGFVLKKLRANGLAPSEKATEEILLRRIFLNITGLPPSIDQLDDYLKNTNKNKLSVVIDSLFGSVDYAEHMAADWMEVSRYADTHGYQDDFERSMWPWRDWVIKAFGENMAYDQFITWQLAGDLLPNATKETILATGFNRNHKITAEGGVIPEEYRIEYVEDRTNTFGTAFLGMTMECARCHDHKYDPISQKEHFELFSFFNHVKERGLMNNAQDIPEPYIAITKEEAQGVLDFVNMHKVDRAVTTLVMDNNATSRPTHILNRGVYDQLGQEVYPNTPEKILPFPKKYPKNRLGLAQWLFNEGNPLTARVAVNRIWQKMFGKGLVESSYDFGNQGALPSHPELLDFLAVKFMEDGWDIQKMIKYIALSATYQQTSKVSSELLEVDPENKLLARAPRLRLSAGSIRDQALAISGLLDREVGGPSVKPYQPEGIWEETTGGGGGSTATYIMGEGADLYRKSLYTFWKRTVPPPNMLTFDASSRDLCSVKREETNTPLQALVLLNDPQLIEAARVMAFNALKESNKIEKRIAILFRKATSRFPKATELERLKAFYNQSLVKIEEGEIMPDSYLNIGQFTVEGGKSKKEWAGLALVAQMILNLDETISRV